MLPRRLTCKRDTSARLTTKDQHHRWRWKRIFKRSEQTRKLQYTEYFGDGDSTAYQEVQDCYENIHIEKKESVGHVQKRVGTALRKLKKENKGIGGKGKLTDSLIDKLQNY